MVELFAHVAIPNHWIELIWFLRQQISSCQPVVLSFDDGSILYLTQHDKTANPMISPHVYDGIFNNFEIFLLRRKTFPPWALFVGLPQFPFPPCPTS